MFIKDFNVHYTITYFNLKLLETSVPYMATFFFFYKIVLQVLLLEISSQGQNIFSNVRSLIRGPKTIQKCHKCQQRIIHAVPYCDRNKVEKKKVLLNQSGPRDGRLSWKCVTEIDERVLYCR